MQKLSKDVVDLDSMISAAGELKYIGQIKRTVAAQFAVLLDDNNRKPMARLHFNRGRKYLGVFDESKTERRIPITALDEIHEHAESLRASVRSYVTVT